MSIYVTQEEACIHQISNQFVLQYKLQSMDAAIILIVCLNRLPIASYIRGSISSQVQCHLFSLVHIISHRNSSYHSFMHCVYELGSRTHGQQELQYMWRSYKLPSHYYYENQIYGYLLTIHCLSIAQLVQLRLRNVLQ